MNKVAFVGLPGSGKTTLARRIAEKLGVKTVNIDQLFDKHRFGFLDNKRYRIAYLALFDREDKWVIDGYHDSKQPDDTWEQADIVIYLNYPKTTLARRIVKRYFDQNKNGEGEFYQDKLVSILRNYYLIFLKSGKMHKRALEIKNIVEANNHTFFEVKSKKDLNKLENLFGL